jgi:hypothetical protein
MLCQRAPVFLPELLFYRWPGTSFPDPLKFYSGLLQLQIKQNSFNCLATRIEAIQNMGNRVIASGLTNY